MMGWPGILGTIAGLSVALAIVTASASPPRWNRDVAGAPAQAEDDHSATLTLTVRTCPAGYIQDVADATTEGLCAEPAGETWFALEGGTAGGPSASTGTSGDAPQRATVRFSGLGGGHYRIRATAPANVGGAFIARCTSDLRTFDSYPFFPFAQVIDSAIDLELLPGESMSCDWYAVIAGPDA